MHEAVIEMVSALEKFAPGTSILEEVNKAEEAFLLVDETNSRLENLEEPTTTRRATEFRLVLNKLKQQIEHIKRGAEEQGNFSNYPFPIIQ